MPSKKRRSREPSRARLPIALANELSDTVLEFRRKLKISHATAYRMMQRGEVNYIQITSKIRRIPLSEYRRLGFVSAE
jgi:hypothetical protein